MVTCACSKVSPWEKLFDALRSAIVAAKSLPHNPFFDPISILKDVTLVVLEGAATQPIQDLFTPSIDLAFDQIDSVLGELRDEVSNFIPTPLESQSFMKRSYGLPATFIVKFIDDSINDTNELSQLLRIGKELRVDCLTLDGNHLTPVGGNLEWLGLDDPARLAVRLNEISGIDSNQKLAQGVLEWMDYFQQKSGSKSEDVDVELVVDEGLTTHENLSNRQIL